MTIDTFKREIAAAVKTYDKFVVCLEKTPEDFEASLVSLMAKAIMAYESRGAGLRHGIALDNQVTIILSQSDESASVVRHLFQSPFALPEERAAQDGEIVHRKITQEGRLNSPEGRVIPFPDNNRHLFQTVGPRCCAASIPGGAAAALPEIQSRNGDSQSSSLRTIIIDRALRRPPGLRR